MDTQQASDSIFLELGHAVYVFQAIEARIKILLPHLNVPGEDEPPNGEGWTGRRKYLDSKEMLGNLIRLLQERLVVDDPVALEQEWRVVVQYRNDVVHNFVLQPFAKGTTPGEVSQSIEYLRVRRMRALPLLAMLDSMLRGFVTALQLDPKFEGEFQIEHFDRHPNNAA